MGAKHIRSIQKKWGKKKIKRSNGSRKSVRRSKRKNNDQSNIWPPKENSKNSSQSGIPGANEGGCLMARIKTVQRFLEHQPQARPGICTILVGLTLFTLGLVLSLLDNIEPRWMAYSLVGVGLLVTFVGSLQLFLYFHNANTKRNQHPIVQLENGKSPEDGRADHIALAAGRFDLTDAEMCIGDNGTDINSLTLPPHNHYHKVIGFEGSYVTQAYKIFQKFRDPLVLRTPTVINFKCEYEFPDDVINPQNHVTGPTTIAHSSDSSEPSCSLPSPTFADEDDDDVIRVSRRREIEEGGVLRFSDDHVEETRA